MRTKKPPLGNGEKGMRRNQSEIEVIILDFPPESSSSKGKASSRNEPVISIDDDDDDDDDVVVDDKENVHKDGSSSSPNSLQVDDDDCQFVSASFRFRKCSQNNFSCGTRFGLDSDESESDFSDSSDCEILERSQWEKAFLEKKSKKKAGKAEQQHDPTTPSSFFKGKETSKSGKAGWSQEEAGPSNLHCNTSYTPLSHDPQSPSFFDSGSKEASYEKETSFTFFGTDSRNPKTSSEMEGDTIAEKCADSSKEEDFAEPSSLSPEIQVEHESSKEEQRKQYSFKQVEQQCQTSECPKESQAAEHSYTKEVVQEEEEEEDATESSSPPHTLDEIGVSNGARCEGESREPIIDLIPSTSEQVQGLQATAAEIDVMLNREILKETDEYKKAQEEEWESRQRQLQLQAEEAQRQRKRRKLANTRQLEMERRQKERVEEVRETQKKDEESMNMKEKVRAEITKSLKVLELGCVNMAALLRGLGIPVNGGISPPPQEVHAAYKRAVLRFHPDRARGDIKQQVEAEEKFKLIARMKDKFLS